MDEDFVIPEDWYQLAPDSVIRAGDKFCCYNGTGSPFWDIAHTTVGKTVLQAQSDFLIEQRPVVYTRHRPTLRYSSPRATYSSASDQFWTVTSGIPNVTSTSGYAYMPYYFGSSTSFS